MWWDTHWSSLGFSLPAHSYLQNIRLQSLWGETRLDSLTHSTTQCPSSLRLMALFLPQQTLSLWKRSESFSFPEAGWECQEAHRCCTTGHILPELLLSRTWSVSQLGLNPARREGSYLGAPYIANKYILMSGCLWKGERNSTQTSYWSCHFNIWTSKEKSTNKKISSPPLRSLYVLLAFIFL